MWASHSALSPRWMRLQWLANPMTANMQRMTQSDENLSNAEWGMWTWLVSSIGWVIFSPVHVLLAPLFGLVPAVLSWAMAALFPAERRGVFLSPWLPLVAGVLVVAAIRINSAN